MSGLRAWWRDLPAGARWAILAAALVALAIVARVWSAAVLGLAAMVAGAIGRAPAKPVRDDRARTAADLQAASARLMAEVHRSENDAARVRDREADRAMVEAAERAAAAPHVEQDAPPAFLVELERRGGRP